MHESKRMLEDLYALSNLEALSKAVIDKNGDTWKMQGYGSYGEAEQLFNRYCQKVKPILNRISMLASINDQTKASEVARHENYKDLTEIKDIYQKYEKYFPFWKKVNEGKLLKDAIKIL
jgi:hypothetical protein